MDDFGLFDAIIAVQVADDARVDAVRVRLLDELRKPALMLLSVLRARADQLEQAENERKSRALDCTRASETLCFQIAALGAEFDRVAGHKIKGIHSFRRDVLRGKPSSLMGAGAVLDVLTSIRDDNARTFETEAGFLDNVFHRAWQRFDEEAGQAVHASEEILF